MGRKEELLEAYRRAGGPKRGRMKRACDAIGLDTQTAYAWRSRDLELRAAMDRLDRGDKEEHELGPGEVPDFLTWRERHCAYLIDAGQRVHRAKNYWFQFRAVQALESDRNVIMVLPPGHLKTSMFGIEYPTWRIMRDRNFRCLMIRANANVAQDNTAAIGVRLSDNDYYADLSRRLGEQGEEPLSNPITRYGGRTGFQPQGRKIGDRWAGGEFTVSGRTSGEKDATVKAIGMDGAIPGYRADLIVIDDPQDPSQFDASGVDYSTKLMKKWERDILGRVLDSGKIVILANRLGPNDFIGMLIERYQDDPDWDIIYFPAIIKDQKTNADVPLCPEVWTMKALERKRRAVGESAWAFHWMQQDTDEATATFTRGQMDACKDYDRALGEIPDKATVRILGVDPAVSGYCAMVAWGVNPQTGMRYLLDFVNEKGMRNEDNIAQRAVYEAERLGCRTIVVEVRNIQQSIFEKVKELCRGKGIKVLDYKTATATGAQAQETEFDITAIGKLMDERMVSLPYKHTDYDTKTRMDELITQFAMWRPRPPGKTSWHLVRDLVMATLFAESEARKAVKRGLRPVRKYRPNVPSWAMNDDGGHVWAPQKEPSEAELVADLERVYGV